MAYVKISPKGKAFLKSGNVAAIVAKAIAARKEELFTDAGLIVNIGKTTITVRSATSHPAEVIAV